MENRGGRGWFGFGCITGRPGFEGGPHHDSSSSGGDRTAENRGFPGWRGAGNPRRLGGRAGGGSLADEEVLAAVSPLQGIQWRNLRRAERGYLKRGRERDPLPPAVQLAEGDVDGIPPEGKQRNGHDAANLSFATISIRQIRFKPWKAPSAWRILYVIDDSARLVTVLQIRHEKRPLLPETGQ